MEVFTDMGKCSLHGVRVLCRAYFISGHGRMSGFYIYIYLSQNINVAFAVGRILSDSYLLLD